MKTKPNLIWSSGSGTQREGFTFVDLLAILAVIAVLITLQVSAHAGTKGRTKVAMCSSNVRQLTLALHLYGSENNDKLPVLTGGAAWPWDLPRDVGFSLLSYNLEKRDF